MRKRYTAFIGTMIVAWLFLLSASAACSKVDHERVAEEVALEWTMTEADGISEEIAAMATKRYGRTAGLRVSIGLDPASRRETYKETFDTVADAAQISDTIGWEIGSPMRQADGRYEVIATASISFDVGPSKSSDINRRMPGIVSDFKMPYGGTVDFKLEIDTNTRVVIASNMPPMSVNIRQMPQKGFYN